MASDPVSATASAVAAGAAGIVVFATGMEVQTIAYAALGASFGIVSTQPLTWWRTVVTFVALVMASALMASFLARHVAGDDPHMRNLLAMLLSPVYPVLRSYIESSIPSVMDEIKRRWLGDRGNK